MPLFTIDRDNTAFGTRIEKVVPGMPSLIPRINMLTYDCAATEHDAIILVTIGDTVTIGQSAASQKDVQVADSSPGVDVAGDAQTIAAGDYLAWADENGVWKFDTVASITGAGVVTMTNNLASIIKDDAAIYHLSDLTDARHLTITLVASTLKDYEGPFQGGYSIQRGVKSSRNGVGDPIILSIDNVTANAAGLIFARGNYSDATNVVVF